ncbi:MAG TPA: VanW family protein [Polyangiaceae bacterium]|nr:VanW family protein [Polyangiaceae bacterium]
MAGGTRQAAGAQVEGGRGRGRRLALAAVALAWGASSLVGGAVVARAVDGRAAPAAEVAGRVLPPGRPVEAWVADVGDKLRARPVNVSLPDGAEELTLGELGVELDEAATAAGVRAAGPVGVLAAFGSLLGRPAPRREVPPTFRLDATRARARLEALKARVDREPVNARVDLVQHERLDETPGRELDVEATLARLEALPHEPGDVLVPALREKPAAVTAAMLGAVDVRKVLSSYETSFSRRGKAAGRALNIAVAAAKLDGRVIGPGETVSFNRVVGPRTEEAGFAHAPEIFDDEMKDGVGGGTCQVASTLHAAAVYGALEMVERRSHSRPSAYAPLGLDATVVDGAVDLKIKNPHPFPLLVHAYLPRPTVLRVELLGAEAPAHVEYRFAGSGAGEDFVRRLTFKPELPPGEFVRKQKGHRGQTVVSRVLFRWADGRTVQRSYRSDYHAVPEVLWVGPGVDESALPEVPAGAVGVERRGLPEPAASPAG